MVFNMNSEEFDDERREARFYESAGRKELTCACSHMDMPGICPGRQNCPLEDDNYEEEETE